MKSLLTQSKRITVSKRTSVHLRLEYLGSFLSLAASFITTLPHTQNSQNTTRNHTKQGNKRRTGALVVVDESPLGISQIKNKSVFFRSKKVGKVGSRRKGVMINEYKKTRYKVVNKK